MSGMHRSVVQTFPSSQSVGGPPSQLPPEHASPVVHRFPSLQGSVFGAFTQPVAGLQESSVQRFPSSQSGGAPPTQLPPEQVSPVVHSLESLQGAVLFVLTHPEAGLQESSVQTFPSLQSSGGPPAQLPPEQASPVVHAFPSLQGAVLLVFTHPVVGLQESSVQRLLSSQSRGDEPTHSPPEQVSTVVQTSPSSQDPEIGE
jgi:hypothetical protein